MGMLRPVHFIVTTSILILTLLNINLATAVQHGSGRVSMKGAIIDTACAIDVGSREQTIDLGTHPISQLMSDGKLPDKKFTIQLTDCRLNKEGDINSSWKKFQVTFSGNATGELFNMEGEATGLSMRIYDSNQNMMMPGTQSTPEDITPGDMTLKYTLNVINNGEVVRAGFYQSTIRFKMDYY